MKKVIVIFFTFFCLDLWALQKCGVKTNEGKELICPDGFSCSFGPIKNWLSCRCKGYVDDPFKRGAKQQIYSPCLVEEPISQTLQKTDKQSFVSSGISEGEHLPEKKIGSTDKMNIVRSFVISGDSYYANGEYDKAILEWYKAISVDNKAAIKLNPYIAKAYAKKGVEAYKKGNYEGALINFNEALRLDPYNENIVKAKIRTEEAFENSLHKQNAQVNLKPRENIPEKSSFEIPVTKKENKEELIEKIFKIFRVVGWISIICFAFFLPWNKSILLSVLNLFTFFGINLFLPVLFAPVIVATSIWVFWDSTRVLKDIPYEERKKIFKFLVFPIGWTTGCFFFWPLFYPLYLSKRFDYLSFKQNIDSSSLKLQEEKKNQSNEKEKSFDSELKSFIKKGEYQKALVVLSKRGGKEIIDYKYFLEIYIKIEDFIRAKLTLNKIVERRLSGEKESDYGFYVSLGNLCKYKKQYDLARELKKMAFEIMKEEIPIDKNPGEFYTLAINLENEGENELAAEIYRYFEMRNIYYSDVSERLKRLRDKRSVSAYQLNPAQNSFQKIAGRYLIEKILGSGGMGVVYRANDEKTGNVVAIKQIHSSLKEYPEEFKRFLKEAEIVKKLKHPNVVSVLDVVENEGETYLIFDYVDGKNLAVILKEKARLPLNECQNIIKDICDAVHYAHKNNIIHRDIKPANIMINSKGIVKIMDFGLACELRESMTRVTHQTMSGTPAYMAPEQYEGIVKKESDIYAIGVCIYEMLTGELPFKTLDFQKDKKNRNYEAISSKLPWLSPAIDKIIDRALDPEPSMRYADAMDLWLDFKEIN